MAIIKNFNLALILLTSINLSQAKMIDEINFSDQIKEVVNESEKSLTLNGIGIRKATWLNIKVYYGALYLEKKSSDQNEILNSSSIKKITMHFVRDVDKGSMLDGWKKAFENRPKQDPSLKTPTEEFLKTVTDVKEGDRIDITFGTKNIKVSSNKKTTLIQSKGFSKELFSLWFINPIDEGLKEGLLGL